MSQQQASQYQNQLQAKEREEKQQAEYERLNGFDFLRALYEMACPGVKK